LAALAANAGSIPVKRPNPGAPGFHPPNNNDRSRSREPLNSRLALTLPQKADKLEWDTNEQEITERTENGRTVIFLSRIFLSLFFRIEPSVPA
jgi:hypothetical protein